MEKYFILLKHRIKAYLTDKMDVLAGFIGAFIYVTGTLITFDSIFKNVDQIGGLSKNLFYLLFGLSQLCVWVGYMIGNPMSSLLVEKYLDDSLSLLLTKPIPILRVLHFTDPDINALFIGLLGVIVMIFNPVDTTFLNLLLAIMFMILGLIMIICLFIIFACFSCLFKTESITSFLTRSSDVFRYPLSLFPKFFQLILIYLIPVGLICYVPIRILQGTITLELILGFFFGFLISVLFAFLLWKFTLYKYRLG